MRSGRRLRRLKGTARAKEAKAVQRILLSATEKPISPEQAARVANNLLANYEAVRALAAREGIEFPEGSAAEILARLSGGTDSGGADVIARKLDSGHSGQGGATFSRSSPVKHSVVVPRHPGSWILAHTRYPLEEYRQIAKRVDVVQLAGVDQAHKEIADTRPVECSVEEGVLAVQHDGLERSLA